MNRDLLEDILKRLKSTSIHNPKFSEAVDILLNLIKVEDDQMIVDLPEIKEMRDKYDYLFEYQKQEKQKKILKNSNIQYTQKQYIKNAIFEP